MKFSFEDDILLDPPEVPKIPLPAGWTHYTLITVLHVIALARIEFLGGRSHLPILHAERV